jgi:SulP family sulfate permease
LPNILEQRPGGRAPGCTIRGRARRGETKLTDTTAKAEEAQPSKRAERIRGELSGGIASAIPGLVHALTLGVLAYAPLGPEHADIGIRAGFAAAIFGGLAAAAFAGTPLPATGARAAPSLILAGFVATLAADPALGIAQKVALASACVAATGVLQLAFGALRLGTLAKFVPYPVVGGFMCGVAVLIALNQLPHVLGVLPGALREPSLAWLATVQPGTVVVGVATAVIVFLIGWRWKRLPAALLGLVGGTVLYYALRAVFGDVAGPAVGPLPGGLPAFAAGTLLEIAWSPEAARHLPALAGTAAVLAIIGSLDSLLSAAAIDAAAGTRHRANRELVAQGIGNLVSAAFGGVPVALSPTRAIPAWRAGGRTRAIGFIAAALLAAVLLAGSRLLALLPLAVMGGVMLTVAWGLVDAWSSALVRRLAAGERDRTVLWSLAVVVLVTTITVLGNFVVAVIVGSFLSMALFIASMNRSLVRALHDGSARPSRRIYGPELAARLAEARREIGVVELEGALFFGSTERLGDAVEAFAVGRRFVVLDLRRVTAIDASGAIALERTTMHMARQGATVLLAGVTPGGRHGLALTGYGAFVAARERRWFADPDEAIEWAEQQLLGERGIEVELPLERLSLAEGLGADELAALRGLLRREEIAAGQTLFREGEGGDRLYALARGAVSISIAAPAGAVSRVVTFAPGALFGEAAMLDGRARSATALVAEDAVVFSLARSDIDALANTCPALAVKLLVNLGRHLSARLRQTTDTLRDLVDSRG